MYLRSIHVFIFVSIFTTVFANSKSICAPRDTIYSDEVSIQNGNYDYYWEIECPKKSLKESIVLFNENSGKILQLKVLLGDKNNTYINLGNNQMAGTFSGIIDKANKVTLKVTYKENKKPISLTTVGKTFLFNEEKNSDIIIPVKFNTTVKKDDFDSTYLTLFKDDRNKYFDDVEVEFANDEKYGVKSSLKEVQAGHYKGDVVFKRDGKELIQPIELNIKHNLKAALFAFVVSILISYLIRFFSINEEKVNAHLRADELLKNVQADNQIDQKEKEVLISQIENHIREINAWLNQPAYYQEKFEVLLKSYNEARQSKNQLAVSRNNFDKKADWIKILKYGVKTTHTIITILLCLIPFKTIYDDNLIFGSNGAWDYLTLFAGILVVVLAAKGLIKDRISELKFN